MRTWNSIDPYKPGSDNLRVGKAVAMGLVVTGHFYGGQWWVPVLFGLWIFAFSSGLFSAVRYRPEIRLRDYYRTRISRLLLPLMTAQLVVILACLAQGRSELLNIDSIFALFGLTRFSVWLGIERISPLGNGLWFLNLLWIFYFSLPLLRKILLHRWGAWITCAAGFIGAMVLENFQWQGVFFFSTAFAFLFGALIGFQKIWFTSSGLVLAVLAAAGVLLIYAKIDDGMMNATWLMLGFFPVFHLLLTVRLPSKLTSGLFGKCDALFLPVYVTHVYLYLGKHADDAWMRHLGFAFSVLLIYLIATFLSRVNEKLRPT